ncbi:dihydrofolate reductase [Paraburkholderia phenazinium]|jgi:dihydrofolate reductase|uniref:Dihydrofolate reductase n=1 Tax=Paraburkholderia phenazinium TaxID=60549 RepID=A0A1G8FAD7_9BURK|nr:dihydrofolate reductase [Paraburkholderia phenazinium]SDH79111.1 dihydrofolate reductase [Paraburkholderia phenazinium]
MLNGKRIAIVAAMARNRVIGAANDIPWKAPGEQRRFRELTQGQLVVMGRRTYESIGRPLPNRDVLVIGSRAVDAERVVTCRSLEQAIQTIDGDTRDEIFIAGGEQIYRLFLPYADTFYLTEVDLEPVGDTVFPELPSGFGCVERVRVDGEPAYTFLTFRRVAKQNENANDSEPERPEPLR